MQTAILVFLLRTPLFRGTTTFWHDNLYFNYPAFQFFAENWLQGTLPLWNPYSHGGEPFYPLLLQMRFLEPITLLTVRVAGLFTRNLPILFHWNRLALSLFFAAGAYLWLRPRAKSLLAKLSLQSLLLFSSLMLNSFRADGALNHVLWVPWLAIALDRLFFQGKSAWRDWAFLAVALGMNLQTYFFALPFTFAFLYAFAVALFYREAGRLFFRQPDLLGKTACLIFCLGLFAAPNLSLVANRGDFLYTGRLLPKAFEAAEEKDRAAPYQRGEYDERHGIGFSIDAIEYGGSPASLWNYAQILLPEGNPWIFGKIADIPKHFGTPSEIFIYLGFLPIFFVFYGMFRGRAPDKTLFAFWTLAFLLLSFGPEGGFHRLLFFFPPLWFLRHLQFATLFVALGSLYFFVLGVDALYADPKGPLGRVGFALCSLLLISVSYGFSYDPKVLTASLAWFVGIPAVFLAWRRRSRVTAATLFLLTLWDLTLHFRRMDTLYGVVPPPPLVTQSSTTAGPLPFPSTRYEAPFYPPIRLWGSQRPRYLSNVERKAYAFSKVMRPEETGGDVVRHALKTAWWDGLYVPRDYFVWMAAQTDPKLVRETLSIGKSTVVFDGDWEPLSFGANHFEVKTTSEKAARFLWKSRFDRDWKVEIDGTPTTAISSPPFFLAVDAEAGTHRLKFSYRPYLFLWALGGFYLAILLSAIPWVESLFSVCHDTKDRFFSEKAWT